MKRKTNIFYNTSIDSNFLTFDNYTEALTGDILAINQKLFPSHFLCCYIKDLDLNECEDIDEYKNNKKEFIQEYLSPYYENKLAFLRDYIDSKNDPTSSNHVDDIDTSTTALQPFGYLIMLLYYYVIKKNNLGEINNIEELENLIANVENPEINLKDVESSIQNNISGIDEYISFPFFSDIIEYDYTGTYTDIICTISPSNRERPIFNINDTTDYISIGNQDDYSGLYGWDQTQYINAPQDIQDTISQEQIFDNELNDEKYYNIQNIIKSISVEKIENLDNTIKFNVIIPLYTSINIDEYNEDIEQTNELELNDCIGVPIGMYFSEKPITLEGSSENYSSNWSLLISTQFKPFPYSLNIINNETTPSAIKDAYITFAEILSKQTNYVDLLNKYNELMINLQNKVNKLESIINNIGTEQNISELYSKLIDLEKKNNNKFNDLSSQIDELRELLNNSRITWHIGS